MRNLKYLLAAAAIGSLMALPQTSSASPLASGLATGSATLPALSEGLVQKVQIYSCREKYTDMTIEQIRFCRGDDYYGDDYGDYGPGPGYGYGYPGYGYGSPVYGLGFPFLSFGFGGWDDDGRRGHRGHRGRRGGDD